MTTQQAVTGVMGPEHVISYEEALTRHTAGAARLTCEEHLRGTLTPPQAASPTSPSGPGPHRHPVSAPLRPQGQTRRRSGGR